MSRHRVTVQTLPIALHYEGDRGEQLTIPLSPQDAIAMSQSLAGAFQAMSMGAVEDYAAGLSEVPPFPIDPPSLDEHRRRLIADTSGDFRIALESMVDRETLSAEVCETLDALLVEFIKVLVSTFTDEPAEVTDQP